MVRGQIFPISCRRWYNGTVTTIVLCGGRSRRLGRDKALEEVGGKGLIERVIERLAPLGAEIVLVTSERSRHLFSHLGLEIVTDDFPGRGPLGGIYSGLKASPGTHSLVVACDMPFLNSDLLGRLVELAPGHDVVIPRLEGKVEPLHAVYSRALLVPIEEMVREGALKISDLLDRVKVRYVEAAECRRLDPELLSFFNVNSEADLGRAQALIERERTLFSI